MKNKKLMFSEARFVFGGSGEKASAKASAGTSVETGKRVPAQAPEGRLDSAKKTIEALAALKRQGLKNALKLSGFTLKGQSLEVDFERTFMKDLSTKIEALLKGMENEDKVKMFLTVAKGLGFTDKDALTTVSRVYASDISIRSKADFHKRYPDFKAYLEDKNLKASDLKCKISQNVGGNYVFEFNMKDPKVLAGHKEWWNKRSKAQKNKAKKAVGKGKESISKPELDRFAKSPLGKIFKFLKGGKDGKKNWLELMQKGEAPLALFIAGLFGYKIGADMYNGAVDILPEKFKGRMKEFERKARASRLSAKNYAKKHPRKTAVVGKGAEPVNAKYFADAIKYNSIPKKGIKLSEDYSLKKGETLVVDLAGGGQIVLPKGKDKAYVNGELAEPGEVYKNVKITFSNTIPKGTVMTGKIDFKRVAPKKAA